MKNQYKINKLKRDLSYCKHGSLQYRLKYFFKAFKNAFNRFIYGYDDRDWYDYYYSFIERNMALFQELVNNVELQAQLDTSVLNRTNIEGRSLLTSFQRHRTRHNLTI